MKMVVVYLLMVGIPLTGIVGVLQLGRDITPAPYVGGTWSLTIHPDSACNVPGSDTSKMVVAQSGTHVVFSFPGFDLPKLKGNAYGAHFRVSAKDDSVRFHGTKLVKSNRMRGLMVGFPCKAARETVLRAVRIAAPGAVDGGH